MLLTNDFDYHLPGELIADRPKEPFELASALGAAGGGVREADPERRAGPQELFRCHGTAVIEIDGAGHPA